MKGLDKWGPTQVQYNIKFYSPPPLKNVCYFTMESKFFTFYQEMERKMITKFFRNLILKRKKIIMHKNKFATLNSFFSNSWFEIQIRKIQCLSILKTHLSSYQNTYIFLLFKFA